MYRYIHNIPNTHANFGEIDNANANGSGQTPNARRPDASMFTNMLIHFDPTNSRTSLRNSKHFDINDVIHLFDFSQYNLCEHTHPASPRNGPVR